MKEPKKRATVQAYAAYLMVRAFMGILGRIPCWLLYPFMAFLGRLLYCIHPSLRCTTLANLRQAFGEQKSEAEIRALARASFIHFFSLIADSLKAPRLLTPARVHRHVSFKGFSMLEPFREKGEGVLFVTAHMGCFEIAGMVWGTPGYPLNVVSRPVNNPYLNDWMWSLRQQLGERKILRKGATREIIRTLRRGDHVAILFDQNQRKRPVFVPFFGRLAATVRSPALIAIRLGIPVVLGWAKRVGKGFSFQAECVKVIDPPSAGTKEERVYELMLALHRELEHLITRDPEQYFWLHNRWKTRPPEEREASTD